MRRCVGLLALLTACGGATQSDVFGEPAPATPGPGTTPSATPTASTAPTTPAPTTTSSSKPPGPNPCTPTTYFRDNDGDGFGGTVAQSACTSPGDGWVTKGGDCDDDDKDVFPGQTEYFANPYARSGSTHSFDYNCNATEEQKLPAHKAATTCTFVINGCSGEGYIAPTPRAGAGVDPLCGATQIQTCSLKPTGPQGVCEATIVTAPQPIVCH
jgi:hypothetical protein